MFGQPELDRKLARNEIRQLTQRISFHYQLQALTANEIEIYVAHRLKVAGYSGPALFGSAALTMLRMASGGIPRVVNVLAHKALMLSFGEGRQHVSVRHVILAAKDTLAVGQIHSYANQLKLVVSALVVVSAMAGWVFIK